jgi:uncharacterized repeat protein (TIGR01451 family)
MAIAVPADAAGITVGMEVEDQFNRFCVGKTIHYTMLVGNLDIPGNGNLTLNVYDRYPNGTVELLETNLSLAAGEYKTYNRSYVVEAEEVGKRIRNLFLVNGTTATGGHCHANLAKDSDILDPRISITKVASPTSDAPCANVTFTINVTNTGDCTLDPVKVVDTLPEGMSYVSSDPPADTYDGTIIWNDVGSLDVNESTTITLVAHIDSGPAGTLTNNVVATGTPKDSMCSNVTNSDTEDVTCRSTSISVNKTASLEGTCPGLDPLTVHINDTVTYCYNVTNTGDVSLTNVTVKDNIYGSVTVGTTTLAPGESTLGRVTHEVTEEDIPSVINVATVNATDPLGESVTDDDDCTINVTHISLPAWMWKEGEEGER